MTDRRERQATGGFAVRLRQVWPGDRNREVGACHQDKQKPGTKPGQQAERKRQSHRCRIYR